MYKKKNKSAFIVAGIIGGLLISSVFVIKNYNMPNTFLKDGVLFVDKVVSYPFSFLEDNETKEENIKLKKEIDKLKSLEYENNELKDEISSLKNVLSINNLLSSKEYINASVINRNLGYWNELLTIDKGTNSGISNNMAVISNGAMVGITKNVSSTSSDVLLFSNVKFPMNISVKVKIDDKEVYGILNNYNNGLYEIIGIVENITIPEGATVVTTGLGNIFPSGIYIGSVSEVVTDNFDLSKVVKVSPGTKFDDIDFVTVVKKVEE